MTSENRFDHTVSVISTKATNRRTWHVLYSFIPEGPLCYWYVWIALYNTHTQAYLHAGSYRLGTSTFASRLCILFYDWSEPISCALWLCKNKIGHQTQEQRNFGVFSKICRTFGLMRPGKVFSGLYYSIIKKASLMGKGVIDGNRVLRCGREAKGKLHSRQALVPPQCSTATARHCFGTRPTPATQRHSPS